MRFNARALKQLRTRAGLSAEVLGVRIKRSRGTIVNWEKGVGEPTFSDAFRLAHVLQCDLMAFTAVSKSKGGQYESVSDEFPAA